MRDRKLHLLAPGQDEFIGICGESSYQARFTNKGNVTCESCLKRIKEMTPKVRSFSIASEPLGPGKGIWWWVRIYDDVLDMRAAAERYKPNQAGWEGVMGCCQPVRFGEMFIKGKWVMMMPPNKLGGVIRLVSPFTYEQACHELGHAALATYRQAVSRSVRLERDCGPSEEAFCYILGELSDQFHGKV